MAKLPKPFDAHAPYLQSLIDQARFDEARALAAEILRERSRAAQEGRFLELVADLLTAQHGRGRPRQALPAYFFEIGEEYTRLIECGHPKGKAIKKIAGDPRFGMLGERAVRDRIDAYLEAGEI